MTDYVAILKEMMVAGYKDAALLAAFARMCVAVGGGAAQPVQVGANVQPMAAAARAGRPAAPKVEIEPQRRSAPTFEVTAPPDNAKALARKAIAQSMLSPSTIALFSHLIERFNLATWRCDPGSGSLADDLGLSVRQVRRSVAKLVSSGLIGTSRHGGRAFANAYLPNWPLIVERAAEGDIEAKRPTLSAKPDKVVTQNHLIKPDSDSMMGQPQRRRTNAVVDRRQGFLMMPMPGGRDKSEAAVRAKLNTQLNETLQPMERSQFVEGLTRSMSVNWSPAIEAEMHKAGSGLPILLDAIRDVGSPRKATG